MPCELNGLKDSGAHTRCSSFCERNVQTKDRNETIKEKREREKERETRDIRDETEGRIRARDETQIGRLLLKRWIRLKQVNWSRRRKIARDRLGGIKNSREGKKNTRFIPLNETKRAHVKRNVNPIAFGMFDYDAGRIERGSEIREGICISHWLFFIRRKLPRFNRTRYSVSSITACHKCIDKIDNPAQWPRVKQRSRFTSNSLANVQWNAIPADPSQGKFKYRQSQDARDKLSY